MRRAPRICASSISILPRFGATLIAGNPAASLSASAASNAGSGGASRPVM
jgi:hypothetical protein